MHAGGRRRSAPQSDLCLVPEQANASNGSSKGLHIILKGQTDICKVLYPTEIASGETKSNLRTVDTNMQPYVEGDGAAPAALTREAAVHWLLHSGSQRAAEGGRVVPWNSMASLLGPAARANP